MLQETVPFGGNVKRAPVELAAWLAKRTEAALEPALPVIDAHIHLWNGSRGRFLADDFRRGAEGHNVLAALFVQAFANYRPFGSELEQALGETEFVVQVSESGGKDAPVIAPSIVAFADLNYGERVRPLLEQHAALAKGRLRGIRHGLQYSESSIGHHGPWRVSKDQMQATEFRKGFAQLAPLGLSFDAWLFHPQLPDLRDLAKAFPDTTIVLNHIGMPLGVGPYHGKHAEVFTEWKRSMAELAELPNVIVKVGGLGMILFGFGFEREDTPVSSETLAAKWRPYVESVIETFGIERCMFESNFPPDAQTCSYGVLLNAFKRITSGLSPNDKHTFYVGTASKTYKLPQFLKSHQR